MKINEIYSKYEAISLDTYLNKCGVKDIEEFLNPTGKYLDDCFDYYNMNKAVEMFKKNIGKDTYILCDSGDVDGISSTVILFQYMKQVNKNWNIDILIHEGKERGLQDETLFKYIQDNPRPFLIIPDSGTNDCEEAEQLKDYNIDILVLDHHTIVTPIENGIVVNNQDEKSNVSRNGSGCLVTHKFLSALDKSLDCVDDFLSAEYIDMVALSLVSDVMNMADEQNRTYYHYGIETIDCIKNSFLKALFEHFIGDKPYTQRDIAFKIIPKLNSICRSKSQELKYIIIRTFLGSENIDYALDKCAEAHQNQIATVNNIIENNINEILSVSNDNLVVFSCDDMPKSYSGLIAGKIMDISGGKPTLVGKIIDNEFIGSLRSPIPMQTELDNNDLVEWARGHEQSCGILIKEDNIQPLIDYYNHKEISYEPCIDVLRSYAIQDVPCNLFDLFKADTDVLWGNGITKPIFELHNIIFTPNDLQILGKNHRTIKLISGDISFLFFNITNKDRNRLGLENDDKDIKLKLSVIGTPSINIYVSPYGKTYVNKQIIVDNFTVKKYILGIRENVFK